MKNTLLILLLLVVSESVFAGMWTLSVNPELVDKKDRVKKSILKFHNRSGQEFSYTPPAYPWGFYSSKEQVVHGNSYHVTYWSGGSQSVYFRVFQPDKSETPVCEFETQTENPKLRFKDGTLQYLEIVLKEEKKKTSVWKKCSSPTLATEPSKTPASVPKLKLKKASRK